MEYGIRDRIEKTFTDHMFLQEQWNSGTLKQKTYLLLQEPRSSLASKVKSYHCMYFGFSLYIVNDELTKWI